MSQTIRYLYMNHGGRKQAVIEVRSEANQCCCTTYILLESGYEYMIKIHQNLQSEFNKAKDERDKLKRENDKLKEEAKQNEKSNNDLINKIEQALINLGVKFNKNETLKQKTEKLIKATEEEFLFLLRCSQRK
ncbi:17766_t:CDS:2, partial [Cetraspora pellucida]